MRNVSISTPRNCPIAPDRNISVARWTIGAYFQLWTGTIARPVSLARLRASLEFNQVQQQRFFTKDVPSPSRARRASARRAARVVCKYRQNRSQRRRPVPRSWKTSQCLAMTCARSGGALRCDRPPRRSSHRGIFRRPASAHDEPPHRSRLSHLATRLIPLRGCPSPGFIGTYQWLCVTSLALFGVGGNPAFAFSILLHALWFVPTTLAGLAILLRRAAGRLERPSLGSDAQQPRRAISG